MPTVYWWRTELADGVIGNTGGFDPLILGSSPGRVAKKFKCFLFVKMKMFRKSYYQKQKPKLIQKKCTAKRIKKVK